MYSFINLYGFILKTEVIVVDVLEMKFSEFPNVNSSQLFEFIWSQLIRLLIIEKVNFNRLLIIWNVCISSEN